MKILLRQSPTSLESRIGLMDIRILRLADPSFAKVQGFLLRDLVCLGRIYRLQMSPVNQCSTDPMDFPSIALEHLSSIALEFPEESYLNC